MSSETDRPSYTIRDADRAANEHWYRLIRENILRLPCPPVSDRDSKRRLVTMARQCGKYGLMRALMDEDHRHHAFDIENGTVEFVNPPSDEFTIEYEVPNVQELMDRLTDSERKHLNPDEDAKDIDRAYANLTGKKKPAFERTDTDQKALEAAKAKRARKAAKRLRTAEA